MKTILHHLPLEAYKSRYTELLADWEKEAFQELFEVNTIEPSLDAPVVIKNGRVLDSVTRPVWAMRQIEKLLLGPPSFLGEKAYFSDFFHPGLESLAYSGSKIKCYSFCWAQTFDCYDFTVPMIEWMRPWEIMAFNLYSHVFVACSELKELIVTALPYLQDRISAVGLPFSYKKVRAMWRADLIPQNKIDVVYTSRWDREKDPQLFLDLVNLRPDLKFAVCTGHEYIRGTDEVAIQRLLKAEEAGKVKVYRNLTKAEYYSILSQCQVQANFAYQDWVSYTLLEALTFGCEPLYPNFRAFPAVLGYSEPNLYQPGSAQAASAKLDFLLHRGGFPRAAEILDYHSLTLNRIAEHIYTN